MALLILAGRGSLARAAGFSHATWGSLRQAHVLAQRLFVGDMVIDLLGHDGRLNEVSSEPEGGLP